MANFLPEAGGGRSGGGGIYYPDPPIVFTGANITACRTARDAAFGSGGANEGDLADFQSDQYLAIVLRPAGAASRTETYLPGNEGNAYDPTQWIDRGSSAVTDAHIDSRIAAPGRANHPSGTWPDARIPADVARDAEVASQLGGKADSSHSHAQSDIDDLATKFAQEEARTIANRNNLQAHIDNHPSSEDEEATIAEVLAEIRAGAHISIDRSTPGRITIVGTGESTGTLPADGTLTPDKMDADTATKMAAFRRKFGSAHISAGADLPDPANLNPGSDIRIMTADVPRGISFRDFSDQDTVVTAAAAADIMWVLPIRGSNAWVRIGNIFTGGAAVARLLARVETNEASIEAAVDDIQQAALHISILWPDGTSQPVSYFDIRTLSETFQVPIPYDVTRRHEVSPVAFQIEGYIHGFDEVANLRSIRINGVVSRDNSALGAAERISDGHFNLVTRLTHEAVNNIRTNLSGGEITFAVEYTIGGENGAYNLTLAANRDSISELPDRIPYVHPEYFLEDVVRRISGLRVVEEPPAWAAATHTEFTPLATGSAIGIALLSGNFNPANIPPAAVWGTTYTHAANGADVLLLTRVNKTLVDRQDQIRHRVRMGIDPAGELPQIYTPVGIDIRAEDANYFYGFQGRLGANPGRATEYSLEELTNPFSTVYNNLLGPRAIGSIPKLTEKTATAGASRTWTYTLDAADTEIWIGATETDSGTTALFSRVIPRGVLSGNARQIALDHRNPGQSGGSGAFPDSSSIGVSAAIAGNILTLSTTGWHNATAPIVQSK